MDILIQTVLAAQILFPAPNVTPEPYDGATVRVENGVAVADVVPGRKFCGVNLVLPKPFALNRYREMGVEVSNRTDRTLTFVFHGIHKGVPTRFATRFFSLGPFEAKNVTASHCRKCYGVEPDDAGLDGMYGYDRKHRPDRLDLSGHIDSFIVFCDRQESPASFDVKRLWADGECSVDVLKITDAFFPFVDKFGQYVHADWPGKVHSLEEMKSAARAAEDDLAAHPESPIPGADRFGGWGAGPQLKATGLFRTEKWNGRWWFVDPDGHLFFSLGCDYVCLCRKNRTPTAGRERFFAWLPEREDPLFGDCWSLERNTWPNLSFYRGKGAILEFNFLQANLKRLYGREWRASALDRTHRRLKSWGFNSMGNWSDGEVMAMSRTPYVDNFNLDGVRKIVGDKKGMWRKFPDVYAPDFAEKVFACAHKTRIAKSRTDPWCIGWFVENELHWGAGRMGDGRDLFKAVADSPEDQPARVELLRRVRAAHGAEATLASATAADIRDFAADVAERYFSTVKGAIDRIAPGRLYLGCRFCCGYPEAYIAASKYCDVVSHNCYAPLPKIPRPQGMVDKPEIIGEFHFGSLDRGSLHAGLQASRDMRDRVEHYKAYVRAALADKHLVGVHWFYWHDMPLTGWVDGENFLTGILTVTDNPQPEMVEATRELAKELYRQ